MSNGFSLNGSPLDHRDPKRQPFESHLVSSNRKGYQLEAWQSRDLRDQLCLLVWTKLIILWSTWTAWCPAAQPAAPLCWQGLWWVARLALLMWDTSIRGTNCGGVTLLRFLQSDPQAALPSPLPIDSLLTDGGENSQRAQVRAFCADSWLWDY